MQLILLFELQGLCRCLGEESKTLNGEQQNHSDK